MKEKVEELEWGGGGRGVGGGRGGGVLRRVGPHTNHARST